MYVQRELPAFLSADTDIETVCIHVCMKYMYICMHAYMYVCMYVQRELPAFLSADTDIETVCIYVCMHVCMYVCM